MARTAVTIGFSVPPATADLVERIAAREGRSKSELFRDMVRVYSEQRELEVFEEFAAYGVAKGAQVGARGEADTERAVAEGRA